MNETSWTPPAPPNTPPGVRMSWCDLLFLHWRIDAAALRPLIPEPLEIDTFDGSAWIALVPFRMADTRFRGVPNLATLANFHECNVRTYVRFREHAGVWFFSLDAAHLLPVLGGRWLWSLNYVHSRFHVERDGDGLIDYQLVRRRGPWMPGRSRIAWRLGERLPTARPGSLEHFLTERYWLFTQRRGRIMGGRVWHEPWALRRATVEGLDDTLLGQDGLKVSGEPIAHASDRIDVQGWKLVDPAARP